MTTVFGQLDGLANSQVGHQNASDGVAGVMHRLAGIAEGIASSSAGNWQKAGNTHADTLHTLGMQHSTQYADHSGMMGFNATSLANRDDESTNAIQAMVAQLT